MVIISRNFLASVENISERSTNRIMVKEAMKRTMKKSLEYKHAIYVKNLYLELRKHKIGTTTVESLCGRICNKLPTRRRGTLINQIIKWKLDDAYNILRKMKNENTEEWRKSKIIIKDGNILDSYERLWKREITIYENTQRNKLRNTIQFLTSKYKKQKNVPDEVRGIMVKDRNIPEDYTPLPRIYGDVDLSPAEVSLLTLPPKYAIYEKIDGRKCAAEVEKSLAKLRWEIKPVNTNEITATRNDVGSFILRIKISILLSLEVPTYRLTVELYCRHS